VTPEEDELTSAAITEQVLAANRRFYEALEALDIAAMEACWSPAAGVACLHPGRPWQRGWDEVSSGWEVILSNTGYIEFEIVDVEVTVNDPVAWVTCVERITSAAGEGGVGAAEVAATNLFVLDSTGWRIALHHASPILGSVTLEEG
jgi:ketosteroid isomerase-like protein